MNKIQIYLDSANVDIILKSLKDKNIKGYTTNPSLMKKSNIRSYENFIKYLCKKTKKPISFEIFADKEKEIYKQAKKISSFSSNIYVKIPIVNSKGQSLHKVIKKLSEENIKLNITCVFTAEQFKRSYNVLNKKVSSIISIFCGRIADSGRNPENIIKKCLKIRKTNKVKILWASTREFFNITQAQNYKVDIITVPPEILEKKKYKNYNLKKFSVDTAKMFYDDAKKLNLTL